MINFALVKNEMLRCVNVILVRGFGRERWLIVKEGTFRSISGCVEIFFTLMQINEKMREKN